MMTSAEKGLPKKSIEKLLISRSYAFLLILSLVSTFLLTWIAVKQFEKALLPEVLAKSNVVAVSVKNTVENALRLGIPYDALVGMDEFLADTLSDNPEIDYLKIHSDKFSDYVKTRPSLKADDLISQEVKAEEALDIITPINVSIGVRASYVNEKLLSMFGDATLMLFVCLAACMEIALFFLLRWVLQPFDTWQEMIQGVKKGDDQHRLEAMNDGPFSNLLLSTETKIQSLRQMAGQATQNLPSLKSWYYPMGRDVRFALFLFVLSEELLRSFFPLYVKELIGTSVNVNVGLLVSGPIMAYMFFAGVATLSMGNLIDKFGLKRAFWGSVALSVISLVGLAFSKGIVEVIIFRSISAIGYSVATLACQAYISRTMVHPRSKGAGMTVFVAALGSAFVCGAPIGAVLADVLGKPATLLCAAALALLSALIFQKMVFPEESVKTDHSPVKLNRTKGFVQLLKNWRISLLIFCGILPGKMLLAGLLFYFTPLLLQKYELSQASIGQFFLLYYLQLMIGGAIGSRFENNEKLQSVMVICGSIISGAGAVALLWLDSPFALALAVVSFGLGQCLVLAPSGDLILTIAKRDCPEWPSTVAISLSRGFERVGGVIGAAIAGTLSVSLSYHTAVGVLGVIAVVISLGTLPLFFASSNRK